MSEITLFLLVILAVFSLACSIALIALGKAIDRFPLRDESARERGMSSPAESTRIVVAVFWILFIPGGWAVLQKTTYFIVAGITTLFAISLFMLTALAFSFAVLSTMSNRKDTCSDPALERDSPVTGKVPPRIIQPEADPREWENKTGDCRSHEGTAEKIRI
jgi:hypothetical protein